MYGVERIAVATRIQYGAPSGLSTACAQAGRGLEVKAPQANLARGDHCDLGHRKDTVGRQEQQDEYYL